MSASRKQQESKDGHHEGREDECKLRSQVWDGKEQQGDRG